VNLSIPQVAVEQGNIRPASGSRDPVRQPGPDDFSPARGRELSDRREGVTTTGRGGAGNLRSPSRDARAAVEEAIRIEGQYVKEREANQGEQIYSTGRGGAGNMSRSRSRSRDPSLATTSPSGLSSTGRGGFGNLTSDGRPSVELSKLEEEDRKNVDHRDGPVQHSAGRGGYGNQAAGDAPARERQHIQHDVQAYTSGGRGGAGNILATAAP